MQGRPAGFGDEGFDVAGVEVAQPGSQPVRTAVTEGGRQSGGEVMQVLAGVVDVDDRGGFGPIRSARFQIQERGRSRR